MNKDAYINELLILLRNDDMDTRLCTVDAEKFLESSTAKILKCLVRLKEKIQKSRALSDPNELRLSRLCRQVIEIMDTRGKARSGEFRLPHNLNRMLCEEKLIETSRGICENVETTLKAIRYEQEIAETAERWICNIRAVHAQVVHTTSNFHEEKMFWLSFCKQLDALCDLSLSDDYVFLLRLLQRIGRKRLYYTLETLLEGHRLLKLAEHFNSVFQDFDFSFIDLEQQKCEAVLRDTRDNLDLSSTVSPEQIFLREQDMSNTVPCVRDRGAAHGEPPSFLDQCLGIVDKLMALPKQPRVVQRSVCKHVANLRCLILKHSLLHFTPRLLRLFSQFDVLVNHLAPTFEADLHGLPACDFDFANGTGVYLNILEQIWMGYVLLEAAHKRVGSAVYSDLIQLVRDYELAFKSSIVHELGLGGKPDQPFALQINIKSVCISHTETYFGVLQKLAEAFVAISTPDLPAICEHYSAFKKLFQHQVFRNAVCDHSRSTSRTLIGIIQEMSSVVYFEETQDDLKSIEDSDSALAMAELYDMVHRILVCFEGSSDYKSLERHLGTIKVRLDTYLDSLPTNLHESEIMTLRKHGTADGSDSLVFSSGSLALNKSSMFLIRENMYRIDNLIYHKNLRSLCGCLYQFGRFFDDLSHVLEGYRMMAQTDSILFADRTLESYILSLVRLKWKHFRENKLIEALELFRHLEQKFEMYSKSLEDLLKIHVPKITREGGELTLENLCKYIIADSQDGRVIESLRARAGLVLDACLSYLLDCFQNNSNIVGVKFQVDISNGIILLAGENAELDTDCLLRHLFRFMRLGGEFDPVSSLVFQDLHGFFKAQVDYLVSIVRACEFCVDSIPGSLEGIVECHLNIDLKFKSIKLLAANQIEYFDIRSGYEFSEAERKQWTQRICLAVDGCVSSMIEDLQRAAENEDIISMYENHFRLQRTLEQLKWFFDKTSSGSTAELMRKTRLRDVPAPFTEEAIVDFISSTQELQINGDVGARKRLNRAYNIDLKSTLSREENAQVGQRRKEFCERIDEITKSFYCFECDEFDFIPVLEELVASKHQLCRDLDVFNAFLAHYKFATIHFDLPVEHLRNEYRIYMLKKKHLDEFLSKPVRDNQICFKSLVSGLDANFKSKLLKDLCTYIHLARTPLEYLSRHMNQPFIKPKYFDGSMSLKEYIDTFDEKGIKSAISKSKSDHEICKYLDSFCLNITSHFRYSMSQDLCFVANIVEIHEILEQAVGDHELVVKFNRHKLFVSELESIYSRLMLQQRLASAIRDIQNAIFSIINVFSSTSTGEVSSVMVYEGTRFSKVKAAFSSLVSRIARSDSPLSENCICSIIETSRDTLDTLDSINMGLKTMCDSCRRQSGRLHFVSNEDIIRMMNEKTYVCKVIETVFNVGNVILDGDRIVGVASVADTMRFPSHDGTGETRPGADRITLVDSVALDGQAYGIINLFEKSLRSTLEVYFELSTCDRDAASSAALDKIGSVSIIDELVAELRYFGECDMSSDPSSIPYRIQRVLEYSRDLPDLLSIYPKPVIRNRKLLVGDFEYRFEYYPPTSFVFTFLTAKVFSAIALSHKKSGLILYGPSGTGKTESVRYFCRTIGVPLYTFCCNEKCEAASLTDIIVGCSRTGSYVCFDEFNRLRREVMSAVTECILEHKNKIRVFLTMNLGYNGRFELPKSLKSIFGEILVAQPDIKDIIFYYTRNYRVFEVISELQKRCSCNPHYDFGLRAVKFILSSNPLDMVSKLACFYMAVLEECDRNVLFAVLKDALGTEEVDLDLSYENLLRTGVQVRNGIIVSGGKGKSALINSVAASNNAKIFRYNASNLLLTNDSVFGSANKLTKEWRDSVFLRDLRSSLLEQASRPSDVANHMIGDVQALSKNARSGEVWFVFDGPIRTEWIEDFNSILDDNTTICTNTGERIRVPFSFKFVFECAHVRDATPATLTRVFHINIPEKVFKDDTVREACNEGLDTEDSVVPDETQCGDIGSDTKDAMVPDEIQCKAAILIKKMLKTHDVVFLKGPGGVGKKSVVKHFLDMPVRVVYSGHILDYAKLRVHSSPDGKCTVGEVVYIEEFNKASVSVQEQVREYGEFGRIGEYSVRNLKIICGLDDEPTEMCSRMKRFPTIELKKPKNIENIIGRHLENSGKLSESHRDLCARFSLFLYNSYNLSVRRLLSFSRCMAKILARNDDCTMISCMYFISSVYFGERGGAKRFLESTSKTRVRDLRFNLETLEFEHLEQTTSDFLGLVKKESVIGLLLHINKNVVVRGPRLCGKRRLADRCIEKLRGSSGTPVNPGGVCRIGDIEIIDWTQKGRIEGITDLSSQYIMILDYQTKVNEKLMGEHAVEVRMDDIPLSLDAEKLFECETFENCISSGGFGDNVSATTGISGDALVSIDDTTDTGKMHPRDVCIHPKYVTFPNLYKMADFYATFSALRKKFAQEFENRKRFLRTGLDSIGLFRKEADDLRGRIQKSSERLDEEGEKLKMSIKLLDEEKERACREEDEVRSQRDRIHREIARSEERHSMVNEKLAKAEKLMENSRKSIALINKSQVSEIKSMSSPPEPVRRTVECVYYFLEHAQTKVEWTTLQSYLKRDDFVSKVLSLSGTSGSVNIPENVEKLFKSPGFTLERVNKASRTCGAFYCWISSLITYRDVNNEVQPLRDGLEALGRRVDEQTKDLDAKEKRLAELQRRVSEVECSLDSSRRESRAKALEIEGLLSDLKRLEEVIARLKNESESWKHLRFECPLNYMLEGRHILEYCSNICTDPGTGCFSPDETRKSLGDILEECVEVYFDDRNFKKAVSNAICFGSSILIRGVDAFDSTVYSLLKHRINFCDDPDTKVILQGSLDDCYAHETYLYTGLPRFSISRRSLLHFYENELLNSLASSVYDLKAILQFQILIEDERKKLEQEDRLRKLHDSVNRKYKQINALFMRRYRNMLSFEVLREFVAKNDLFGLNCETTVCERITEFFSHSFEPGILQSGSTEHLDAPFDVGEVLEYGFDYIFVTSFNDILLQLRSCIRFDIEISAGSPENNSTILGLLSEKGGRTVLVKNTEFLPKCTKEGGTNRFIFITGDHEHHPLLGQARVVCLDRKNDFESIFTSLTHVFDVNMSGAEPLIKFHSIVMEMNLDFSSKDLEICIENPGYSPGFLIEIIYFSRMAEEERNKVRAEAVRRGVVLNHQ